jgi:hypothetical protein
MPPQAAPWRPVRGAMRAAGALLVAAALTLALARGASAGPDASSLESGAPRAAPPKEPAPMATQAGCPCLFNWEDANGGVHRGCANPNNDTQVRLQLAPGPRQRQHEQQQRQRRPRPRARPQRG